MVDLRRAQSVIDAFGYRVRIARLRRGLTQQQLAARAHVHRKFVGEIERGETNPSLESMVLVPDALGCEVTDLLPSVVPPGSGDMRRARQALAVLNAS